MDRQKDRQASQGLDNLLILTDLTKFNELVRQRDEFSFSTFGPPSERNCTLPLRQKNRNMKKIPRLSKEVKAYLFPACLYWLHNCSDSMYEMTRYESRFAALADDKFSITDYIRAFHLSDYAQALKDAAAENGDTEVADWKAYMEDAPSILPIGFDEVKGLLC